MQKIFFYYWKNYKNTESAQLWSQGYFYFLSRKLSGPHDSSIDRYVKHT